MVLSLQAIDFLLASSIQDGWPLSDMDCSTDGSVGDDDGDEEDGAFFRNHLSSRGLSGTLVGLNSLKRTKQTKIGAIRITNTKSCLNSNDLLLL